MSLKSFFETGVTLSELTEGKHTGKIVEVTPVYHATDESKSYIKLSIELEDRTISDNRFEKGFAIFISQVKKQLNLSGTTMTVPEVIDTVLATESFDIYASYTEQNGRRYRNLNFLPPLPTIKASELAKDIDLNECPI